MASHFYFDGSTRLNNSFDAGMFWLQSKVQIVHFGLFPYLSVSDRTRKRLDTDVRRRRSEGRGRAGDHLDRFWQEERASCITPLMLPSPYPSN